MNIPKNIHQTWKSAEIPTHLFSPKWINSWKINHPDWTYRLWTDEDNRTLIKEKYSWFLSKYDAYPFSIMRADAARYFILHAYGGLYVDLDFECLKPMSNLLMNHSLVLGCLCDNLKSKHSIPNALMASVGGHPIWTYVFSLLLKRAHAGRVEYRTGSILLRDAWFAFNRDNPDATNESQIISSHLLYPIDWRWSRFTPWKRRQYISHSKVLYPDAYALTYWQHSWMPICSRPYYWFRVITGGFFQPEK